MGMNLLLTGFSGTASEALVRAAGCSLLVLPNDKIMDSRILIREISRQSYDYVFSFGQKPCIKDKIYLETTAGNRGCYRSTDFAYDRFRKVLEANHLQVRISDNAGTSFCNALYWNGLQFIEEQGLHTRMLFLHIPFCKNISEPKLFFSRILTAVSEASEWEPY